MDTSKFKSVTISIDTWNRLHKIAAKDKDLRKKIEEFREECLRNIGVNVVNEQWGE